MLFSLHHAFDMAITSEKKFMMPKNSRNFSKYLFKLYLQNYRNCVLENFVFLYLTLAIIWL